MGVLVVDSVTVLGPEACGAVVVGGSHCGAYAVYLAAAARVRGAILNDAGIGRERAGVGGLDAFGKLGLPCAAYGHRTARIGYGQDAMTGGLLTVVNDPAASLGIAPGQTVQQAADILLRAPAWEGSALEMHEARAVEEGVVLIDSASLVRPEDAGGIVVCGSHGGLLGGRPETALRADAFAALYNDADRGREDAGVSRLPALERRGIAAGTVSAWSARIGEARSTYEQGFISCQNRVAEAYGGRVGMSARDWVARMREARGMRAWVQQNG